MSSSPLSTIIPFPRVDFLSPSYCGLDIDLGAIIHNYKTLKTYAGNVNVSAVVKANAYGLGAARISHALYSAGCRHFFTAFLDEALELREVAKLPLDATIYALNGYFEGTESTFAHYHITPILTDIEKIYRFANFVKNSGDGRKDLKAGLHIDSGMNRTGIRPDALRDETLQQTLRQLNISIVMSQLANASNATHPFNDDQRRVFMDAVKVLNLPSSPMISLANSGGVFLGKDYHFDLLRPGLALYTSLGFLDLRGKQNLTFKESVKLWAKIYQIQTVKKGEAIGYSQTYTLDKDRKIATLAMGYADGYTWSITKETTGKAFAMLHGHKLPLLGRISMDLITVDVSDVPEGLLFEGQRVELLNEDITVHTHSEWTGLRVYEILLKFGNRVKREYRD